MRSGEVAEAAGGTLLHVTNGESTGDALQRSGLEGPVLVWSDLFADGPLAPVEPAEALRALRVRFWAEAGRGVEAALAAEMERRDQVFAEAMADTSALPLMAPALARWLDELPDTAAGLALSERQVLERLADGARTRHELFLEHMQRETVLFNGDAWFFERIAALGPLVESLPEERVAITDTGRRVLAGELDRVQVADLDRWLGGTHLTPTDAWRRENGRLVAPTDQEARAE